MNAKKVDLEDHTDLLPKFGAEKLTRKLPARALLIVFLCPCTILFGHDCISTKHDDNLRFVNTLCTKSWLNLF